MKNTILVAGLLFATHLISSQESITALGGDATGSGGSSSYSVGQLVYTTNTGSGTVSQGVQQAIELFSISNPEPPIVITGTEVVAAKGFSPNGDGVGDTWVIENITDYPGNTVQIFNQWGEQVFQANGYQNDWYGISNKTSSSSKRLPAGPYLYIINFNDAAMAPKRGWVYINY